MTKTKEKKKANYGGFLRFKSLRTRIISLNIIIILLLILSIGVLSYTSFQKSINSYIDQTLLNKASDAASLADERIQRYFETLEGVANRSIIFDMDEDISKEVSENVQSVAAATEEQTASTEEIASFSENLAGLAEDLRNAVLAIQM